MGEGAGRVGAGFSLVPGFLNIVRLYASSYLRVSLCCDSQLLALIVMVAITLV